MIRRVFRQMVITQILSAMTVTLCMLIDSIMIGRFLGVEAMTAYGLASPVLLIFAAFGSMVSAGIQVMCGKTMGKGDMEGTNACFTVSVLLAALVSAAGVAAVISFAAPLTTMLGAGTPAEGNEIFRLTRDYLIGFIIGAPAFIFAQIMVPYMQISGNRSRLVLAVVLMTVGDIIFDLLTVFVFHGGTFGMGLASSLSYYIAFVVGILYFFQKNCMFRFRLRLIRFRVCGTLLKYGIPTVVNQISLVLLVFILNKLLLHVGGNVAVAAYSVICTIGNICYCFGGGVASVALLLSSVFYSEEDRTSLYHVVTIMTFYAVALDLALVVIVFFTAPTLTGLFLTSDLEAKEMAAQGMRLFSLSLLPSALNTSFKNYYQGVNRTGLTELISVLQNFALTALFALILSLFLDTTGVWLGFVCGETLTLVLISLYVWRMHKKMSLSAEAFSLLPEAFGAEEGQAMEVTVRTSREVVDASQRADTFCREHGETPSNSMMIALCIEEMANNIVEHGFIKGGKDHSIDIRLLFKDGKKVIRIRDNCVHFDPIHYLELHNDEDPTVHIGIRMVMKMVKEANYVNSLGLNNLTLVL